MEVEYIPKIVQDSHGNFIKQSDRWLSINDTFEVEPLDEYSKEELDNFGIELGKVIERKLKTENVSTCKVCYKQLKNKKVDCHYKCKVISNRLSKIKKELLDIEFQLFCLRYTEGDADIQVFNSLP
jgi:hypothetical protein